MIKTRANSTKANPYLRRKGLAFFSFVATPNVWVRDNLLSYRLSLLTSEKLVLKLDQQKEVR